MYSLLRAPDVFHLIAIISNLIAETMQQLKALLDTQDDNPRLNELAKLIRKKFTPPQNNNDRGLIFVQTRELTRALCEWIEELDSGAFKHIKPKAFTGVHATADKGG